MLTEGKIKSNIKIHNTTSYPIKPPPSPYSKGGVGMTSKIKDPVPRELLEEYVTKCINKFAANHKLVKVGLNAVIIPNELSQAEKDKLISELENMIGLNLERYLQENGYDPNQYNRFFTYTVSLDGARLLVHLV